MVVSRAQKFAVDLGLWRRLTLACLQAGPDEVKSSDSETAADAVRRLNESWLSVSGLYTIAGVDWLTAAEFNFSSTTALRFAD